MEVASAAAVLRAAALQAAVADTLAAEAVKPSRDRGQLR